MKIISILNYKGGVGKTTLTSCTAQALALIGFRVLAVDNDSQQNLSIMLDMNKHKPNIRDVYHSSIGIGSQHLFNSIKKTGIPDLHLITSSNELCNSDVKDPYILKKCIKYCGLDRFYDYVFIDNKPGLDLLQESAIHASDEIFVPTELSSFAISGILDLQKMLLKKFPGDCGISKIIPNCFKNTKQHNIYILNLIKLFPEKVTRAPIPYDSVFDSLVRERKILFLNRLFSRAAASYLKLIHDLFDIDENHIWKKIHDRRKEHRSKVARERFLKQRQESKKT